MGVFSGIKNYFTNRRRQRLEDDLMWLSKRAEFNPRYVQMFENINTDEEFSKRVGENLTWFMGKPALLRQFYKTNMFSPYDDTNLFWALCPSGKRMVHSGIPSLISTKMATILFGASFDTAITVYKVDEDGKILDDIDDRKSKDATDMTKELLNEINFTSLLNEGAVTESWGGHVFYKLSYDIRLSPYPILEVVDIRSASVVKERGITQAIIFKNWYNKGSKQFCHHEIYTTLDDGTSTIINKLYQLRANGDLVERALTDIEETSELEEQYVFPGLMGLLAFEKPNKLPNNEFIDSPYGASDYAGAVSAFDSLDEILSEIIQEVRDNKTIRYIPSSMISYNLKGELAALNSFITNYVKVEAASQEEQGRSEINITQISDKTLEHLEKWKVALTTAINKAELSPLALGITGLEAVNAGMESQQERNKATLETRSKKLELWEPFVEKMILKILEFNSYLKRNKLVRWAPANSNFDLDLGNSKVDIRFGDYVIESEEQRINKWSAAKMGKVASTETAIDRIYRDWDEQQKRDEVNRIKYESNISFDTPDTLQFSDLLDSEEETENEEG